MEGKESLWGIDLGGTKIEGAVLDPFNPGEVLFRKRVPTEANKGYEHVLSQVEKLVSKMAEAMSYRPERIGIGTPGTLIPDTGLMKNCNAVALNGKPLKTDIEKLIGIKVEMANDANCFALAEARMGVVQKKYPDAKVVFGIILGTGVGGGIVVNGEVIGGHHGIGGEWGHNILTGFSGRDCFCGKTSDNESILSGPSLQWFYEKHTGVEKSMKEIVELARQGIDKVAVETIARLTSGFAQAISLVVNIIDPDVIVIGGGVGNIDELYTEGASKIAQHVFNQNFTAPIEKPLLGDSAGVFGAAYLVS